MIPSVLQLPDKEDPASFIQKNQDSVINEYIQSQKLDFIDFKFQLNKSKTTPELIKSTKNILQSLSIMPDKIAQKFYIRRAAKILKIDENDLIFELKKIKNPKSVDRKNTLIGEKNTTEQELDFSKIKFTHREEFQLIRLIILYGELKVALKDEKNISVAELIISELDHDSIQFSEEIFNIIYNDVKDLLRNKEQFSSNYFLNHFNLNISKLASLTIGEQHFLGNWKNKDIVVLPYRDRLEVFRSQTLPLIDFYQDRAKKKELRYLNILGLDTPKKVSELLLEKISDTNAEYTGN